MFCRLLSVSSLKARPILRMDTIVTNYLVPWCNKDVKSQIRKLLSNSCSVEKQKMSETDTIICPVVYIYISKYLINGKAFFVSEFRQCKKCYEGRFSS